MRITITLLFLFIILGNTYCQNPKSAKEDVIDSLLTACKDSGLFNGVALVADEGEIILHKGYGISDLENQSPLKLSDRFYIGSLTKQFTSVLILKLQEQGFININNPIADYLDEFEDSTWADITVYHLLTHTSGLGNYTSHPDFERSIAYSEQHMIKFIKHPLLFKPGAGWSYSNSGYFLLGIIAERLTNKDYGSLLNEEIFKPLAMKNTAFNTEWLSNNFAKGYTRTIDGMKPMPVYAASTLFSTGGIYSTAHDLYSWTQALNGNKFLTDKSKEILFKPFRNDYACGFFVKKGIDKNGNKFERHFHGGIIHGYHSFILKRVPQKQVVILLDNFYNQGIQTIKNRIWSALIEERVREIKPELSNLLFDASAKGKLVNTLDSITDNPAHFEKRFTFEEFDINKVAYRLMEAERYTEAHALFTFNINRYPDSWNVYDGMGELHLIQAKYEEAEKLYKKSLVLNPDNVSAVRALEKIKLQTANADSH